MIGSILPEYHSSPARTGPGTILSRRANLLKLVTVLLSVAGFFAIYHWVNRGYASGFVFTRLGFLAANLETGGPLLERYASFPFAATYLAFIQTTLRTTSIQAAFLPVIPVVSLLFLYPFARLFLDNKLLAAVSTVPTYLSVFVLAPHFAEYLMGRLFFLLFVVATVLFLNPDTRYRRRFGALALAFYLGVKFFAPPMEVWAVSWVGVMLGLLTVGFLTSERSSLINWSRPHGQVDISLSVVIRVAQLAVVLGALLLVYNPKLYGQLLVDFQLQAGNVVASFQALLAKIVGGSGGAASQYTALSESPRVLQLANITKYLLIGGVILSALGARLLRDGPLWLYSSVRETLAFALLVTYTSELLVYAAVGAGIQIRYVILVFPILAIYYISTTESRSLVTLVVAGLLLTSAFGVAFQVAEQPSREYAGTESTTELVEWDHEYASSDRVATDHHTVGLLIAAHGEAYGNAAAYDLIQLDESLYSSLDNPSRSDQFEFDYLVVNQDTKDEPAMQGPPTWTMYEPLGKYADEMNREENLQKVYNSESYAVYRSSGDE